jgi:translation elongation factor EF-4
MRDAVAGLVAIILLLVAASLATTLQWYRRSRKTARESEGAQGRQIIAELPTADDLVFVSQDSTHLYYGAQAIPKESIVTVRVLINGAPIAAYVSRRHAAEALSAPTSFEDRPEGIARDRWDVAIEAQAGTTLITCGAIRERVSQELARTVFDAVKRDIEERDHHSISGSPAR